MASNKKKLLRWLLVFVLAIMATGGIIGYRMYNKPHRNVEAAKGLTVTATVLATDYESNEAAANTRYLDKVLEVNGEITGTSKNQKAETVVTLKGSDMSGVICTLEGSYAGALSKGNTVNIKGICTGYLTDVVLVRCVVEAK